MIIKSNKNVYKNYFGEDGISKIYAGENLVFGQDSSIITPPVWNDTFIVDGITYRVNQDTSFVTVSTMGGSYTGDIVIPAQVNYNGYEFTVDSVDNGAFAYKNMTSLTLPATISNFGNTGGGAPMSMLSNNPATTLTFLGAPPESFNNDVFGPYNNQSSLTTINVPQEYVVLYQDLLSELGQHKYHYSLSNLVNGISVHNLGSPMYFVCNDSNGATISMKQTFTTGSSSSPANMSYSTDGSTWTTWTYEDIDDNTNKIYTFATINLSKGNKLYVKGNNANGIGYGVNTNHGLFITSGALSAGGNAMSLLYGDNFENQTTVMSHAFIRTFQSTTISTAPELPATTLGVSCYQFMFASCTSLTGAPELPARSLNNACYHGMFGGCTSLTKAPELPALSLSDHCYHAMFENCSNLNYVKAMFTTDISSYRQYWLDNVSSTGTFVKNVNATWTESGVIPSGWTVETASE